MGQIINLASCQVAGLKMYTQFVHVAIGVIQSSTTNKILLSQRQSGQRHAGLWEFPGGKLKEGEDVLYALQRELQEETGLIVDSARPLIKIKYQYYDQNVMLHVWKIDTWHGDIEGREGQVIDWVEITSLRDYKFPEANYPIVSAAQLPTLYLISPDLLNYDFDAITKIKYFLDAGLKLLQLRCRGTESDEYRNLVIKLIELFNQYDASLILNTNPSLVRKLGASGVHLNSERLMNMSKRPLDKSYWVSASCHDFQELQHAESIGIDFVSLSPVKSTKTHPDVEPLGWNSFEELVAKTNIPVYALGGLKPDDMSQAWRAGGHGLAMISAIWDADNAIKDITKCV